MLALILAAVYASVTPLEVLFSQSTTRTQRVRLLMIVPVVLGAIVIDFALVGFTSWSDGYGASVISWIEQTVRSRW